MADPRTVLVTGASGFVGSYLARSLVEMGHPVRGLVRPGAASLPEGVERRETDFAGDTLDEPLGGVEVVLHCLGRAHQLGTPDSGSLEGFRQVNVELTRQVVRACLRNRVEHLVLLSSVAAVHAGGDAVLREGTPEMPASPYGISKLEAEHAAREGSLGSGLRVTVLRPPMIYGPGMKGNPLRLFRLIDRGWPLPLGSLDRPLAALYVGNLSEVVQCLLRSGGGWGRTFFVADGFTASTAEFTREAARALGRRPRLVPVPASILRLAARLADVVTWPLGGPAVSEAVERLTRSLEVDVKPLSEATGYRPRFSLEQALRETARWYRSATTGLNRPTSHGPTA